jgi:hypothetical protein
MLKRKIRIGYEDVKLDLVDSISSDNGDHVFGEFDSIKNSIVLDKKQTPRSLANCLLHEVIHAVIYQSGLNSDGNCLSNEKDEELAVNAISNQLSQVIRDNKWFLPYIQKSLFKDVKAKDPQTEMLKTVRVAISHGRGAIFHGSRCRFPISS